MCVWNGMYLISLHTASHVILNIQVINYQILLSCHWLNEVRKEQGRWKTSALMRKALWVEMKSCQLILNSHSWCEGLWNSAARSFHHILRFKTGENSRMRRNEKKWEEFCQVHYNQSLTNCIRLEVSSQKNPESFQFISVS